MRFAALAVALVLFVAPAAVRTIPAAEAGNYVGQSVTVEGTVSGVSRLGSVTFIDMGGCYPNSAFAGVIFADDMAASGDVSGLAGKTVDVTGVVKLYKGKPEIVIRSKDQIRVP